MNKRDYLYANRIGFSIRDSNQDTENLYNCFTPLIPLNHNVIYFDLDFVFPELIVDMARDVFFFQNYKFLIKDDTLIPIGAKTKLIWKKSRYKRMNVKKFEKNITLKDYLYWFPR